LILNFSSEIEDCTQQWTFPRNNFDFIHMRGLVGSIQDWDSLFRNAYETLKPGGWVQSYEPSPEWETDDDTIPADSALKQWGRLFIEGGRKLGRSFTVVADGTQRNAMERAGFVGIDEFDVKQPIGKWPADAALRERGEFVRVTLERDAEGLLLFIADLLGWRKEEVVAFLAQFRREVRSGRYHAFYRNKVVWGRKPG